MAENLSDGDPNSFSNPDQCAVTDMDLHLEVNFAKRVISGYVDITVERKNSNADISLDTLDLAIHNVRNKSTMEKMNHVLSDPVKHFGSKLEIKLPKTATKRFTIRIDYETSPKATGLQWLEPSQTAGKKHPYVYSQCEAIHARSVLPCQDSPVVKATYTATITVPYELVALMGAVSCGEEMDEDPFMKNYKFVQKVPIPSYLIAIAVGALESREIGPRSHVWSEKEYVDKAAEEFSETEKVLQIAEDLFGPYVWEVYNLLILPPSFPLGGMENPCLTFITPTLLAGDKSLVDVVVHEIVHSWTGNLVTNRNFEHFWLNEGFTVFGERKILGRIHSEAYRQFHALGGWKKLQYDVQIFGEEDPLTHLVPCLKGVDPDSAFNSVPYEKGHTFLFYLEQLLGGPEIFEKFFKDYIEEYKYQSIDTGVWKSYLYKYFPDKEDILNSVDWNAWLYTPGMPPIKPEYDASLAQKCVELCRAWVEASESDLGQFSRKDMADMSKGQITEFVSLLLLEPPFCIEKILKLHKEYKLGEITNAEIRFRWIRLCLKAHWKDIIPNAVKFITEQLRMKFVRPIYRDLYEWDETRELAVATYKDHVSDMMSVTLTTLGNDMHLLSDSESQE